MEESAARAREAKHRASRPRAHPPDVPRQSDLECPAHSQNTAEARPRDRRNYWLNRTAMDRQLCSSRTHATHVSGALSPCCHDWGRFGGTQGDGSARPHGGNVMTHKGVSPEVPRYHKLSRLPSSGPISSQTTQSEGRGDVARVRVARQCARAVTRRAGRRGRCGPPSVPSRPSMYSRISGAKRSRLRSWLTRARVTPCRRASAAAFLTAPVSISRRHARARVRASIIRGRRARAARPRGPQAWPATAEDGTQQDSSVFAGTSGWHAAPSGRGPLERGPSSGCTSDGPHGFVERRGPPARDRTGRAG